MKARFAEVPEAVQNTLEVADKCNLEIEFEKLHYPVFHPPEHFTREGYLRHWLAEGLRKRYGIHARAEGGMSSSSSASETRGGCRRTGAQSRRPKVNAPRSTRLTPPGDLPRSRHGRGRQSRHGPPPART